MGDTPLHAVTPPQQHPCQQHPHDARYYEIQVHDHHTNAGHTYLFIQTSTPLSDLRHYLTTHTLGFDMSLYQWADQQLSYYYFTLPQTPSNHEPNNFQSFLQHHLCFTKRPTPTQDSTYTIFDGHLDPQGTDNTHTSNPIPSASKDIESMVYTMTWMAKSYAKSGIALILFTNTDGHVKVTKATSPHDVDKLATKLSQAHTHSTPPSHPNDARSLPSTSNANQALLPTPKEGANLCNTSYESNNDEEPLSTILQDIPATNPTPREDANLRSTSYESNNDDENLLATIHPASNTHSPPDDIPTYTIVLLFLSFGITHATKSAQTQTQTQSPHPRTRTVTSSPNPRSPATRSAPSILRPPRPFEHAYVSLRCYTPTTPMHTSTSRLTTLLLTILSVSTASHASTSQKQEKFYEVKIGLDDEMSMFIQASTPLSTIKEYIQHTILSGKMYFQEYNKKVDVTNYYCFNLPDNTKVAENVFQDFVQHNLFFSKNNTTQTTENGSHETVFHSTFQQRGTNEQSEGLMVRPTEFNFKILVKLLRVNEGTNKNIVFIKDPSDNSVKTIDIQSKDDITKLMKNFPQFHITSKKKILDNNNTSQNKNLNILKNDNNKDQTQVPFTSRKSKKKSLNNDTSLNNNNHLNNTPLNTPNNNKKKPTKTSLTTPKPKKKILDNNNTSPSPMSKTNGRSLNSLKNNTQNIVNNNNNASNQAGIYILVVFGLAVCAGIVYAMIPSAPTSNSHKPNQDTPQQTS